MFRALKNWMTSVALFTLIAAQVTPASALTISFTTAAPPLAIVSTTPTNNATGVAYSPTIRVDFNQNTGGEYANAFKYAANNVEVSGVSYASVGSYTRVDLGGTSLLPGTQYYFEFDPATTTGGHMDPADPANQPYYDTPSGLFRFYFTTATAAGWQSTVINGVTAGINGGQTNVPVNATVKVKTTAALNGTTVNATNVVLHQGSAGGTIITATAVLDPDDATNKTVLVTPSSNLLYSTTYYLVLSNVADTLGNVLP